MSRFRSSFAAPTGFVATVTRSKPAMVKSSSAAGRASTPKHVSISCNGVSNTSERRAA